MSNFKCDSCSSSFDTKGKLQNHARNEHIDEVIIGDIIVRKTTNGFCCPKCTMILKNGRTLTDHYNTHKSKHQHEDDDDDDEDSGGIDSAFHHTTTPELSLKENTNKKVKTFHHDEAIWASCDALMDDEKTKQDKVMIAKLGRWTPLCYHTDDTSYAFLTADSTAAALATNVNQIGSWSTPTPTPAPADTSTSMTTTTSGHNIVNQIKATSPAKFIKDLHFEEITSDQVKLLNKDWLVYPHLRFFASQLLAGAIVIDDSKSLFLNTVEPYGRDSSIDAHFERRLPGNASSYPTAVGPYGHLTIQVMPGAGGNENAAKLVVGTRTCNFLVTSSLRLDANSVNMGPSTTHFAPSSAITSRLFLDTSSIQLATALLNDTNTMQSQEMAVLFQLKQVRSKFDCLSTYTLCRSSSTLSSYMELQPATIWTLCENDSQQKKSMRSQEKIASGVFRLIAVEVIKKGKLACLVKEELEDLLSTGLEKERNTTKIGVVLQGILGLFTDNSNNNNSIKIIHNASLNKHLVELADLLVSGLREANKSKIERMKSMVY
ncbi:unnamed protein product [Absidia cylindrospora]